ncbi:unnamed protein product [Darwinula stevensoni]|uniref:Uncharacterized protein n=1 Tax=Darwinula stevensoni TaxID=69355 RepID=A0A7R8X3M6_9CRUS|nr:unnamed protein product [Darwinula stevensoni]CAG0885170.1 unnamed protein product [Darwinula stevensoni]
MTCSIERDPPVDVPGRACDRGKLHRPHAPLLPSEEAHDVAARSIVAASLEVPDETAVGFVQEEEGEKREEAEGYRELHAGLSLQAVLNYRICNTYTQDDFKTMTQAKSLPHNPPHFDNNPWPDNTTWWLAADPPNPKTSTPPYDPKTWTLTTIEE